MTDYIKREDAIRAIRRRLPPEPFMKRNWDKWFKENENLALLDEEVCDLPRADVAPVRHGRWAETVTDGFLFVSCSACGFKTGRIDYNYCPNCGAKMDGGDTDA